VSVPLLQTDVQGSPGGAGAPLVDEAGRLVGIILGVQGAEPESGLTFAVPARFVAELLEAKESADANVVIQRAYLGVQLETAEDDGGAKINQVIENTPAAAAGLQEGEVIVAVNDRQVQTAQELSALIGELPAGAKVTLTLRGEGEVESIEVVLGKAPERATHRETDAAELGIELARPGQYRVVPLPVPGGGQEADAQRVTQALSLLLPTQQQPSPQNAQRLPPTTQKMKTRALESEEGGLTPLTIYVQRSETDRRLEELSAQVKALRDEVQQLAEQLKGVTQRLPAKGESMTREQAIQALREEFLKKLDDLVRQQEAQRK
jgi:membrane-associated protease RseP (regulator of RpoE activity)